MAETRDTAGVIAPPPLLYTAGLLLGLLLHRIAPIPLVSGARALLWMAGGFLIALGVLASTAVVLAFRKAATAVSPLRPATSLVRGGPYRYSRNPDYIGQTAIYVGIAMAANTWWPFLLLPLLLVIVHRGVVRREERYLEAKFGPEYCEYQQRVPRWL